MGHVQGTRSQDLRVLSTTLAAGGWKRWVPGLQPGTPHPAQPAVPSMVEAGAYCQAPAHRGWALLPCTHTPRGTRLEDWVPPAPRRCRETFVGRWGAGHNPQIHGVRAQPLHLAVWGGFARNYYLESGKEFLIGT